LVAGQFAIISRTRATASGRQPGADLVHQINVVMVFGPVIADEDHPSHLLRFPMLTNLFSEPEYTRRNLNGSVLNPGTTPHRHYTRPHRTGRGTI
jgi:hypothetical protein